MPIRYKTTTLNGKPIPTHRKVWILHNGPIPDGYHVHHKNEDKFDNRIENLELVQGGEHARQHSIGRPAWNRGTEYGKTEAYQRSNAARMKTHLANCLKTKELCDGRTQAEVAGILGISRRQVSERLRYVRQNGSHA